MRILLTGSQGYIGSVLFQILKKKFDVIGLDVGYFKNNVLGYCENDEKSIQLDIRNLKEKDLESFDVIIHLAGLSNDPLGEFSPKLTKEINYQATVNLANMAKKVGVSRFIFSSSQSLYGISNSKNELDEYDSEKTSSY